MSTMAKGTKGAMHELEDLEVREVSIVDKPAIKRRFLIIKRNTEASEMPGEVTVDLSILDDAEELLDILALEDETPSEPEPIAVSDLDGLEAIFKATTAGQAVRQLAPMLQRLMTLVSGMKKLGDGPVPAAMAGQLRGVIGALSLMAGQSKAKTEKLEGGKLQQATKALEKLVALISRLKDADGGSEIGSKEASEMGSIASMLSGLVPGGAKEEGKKPPKPADDGKGAAKKADDGDPIIVLKAGAKMKKVRLSQFRKAVETLASLLKELEGEQPVPEKDKDKKKTTKAVEPTPEPKPDPVLIAKIEALTETVATLTAELTKIEELAKRVDGIENLRPVGADDDPPKKVEKNKKSMWTGLV